jgi:hypothetical protein
MPSSRVQFLAKKKEKEKKGKEKKTSAVPVCAMEIHQLYAYS